MSTLRDKIIACYQGKNIGGTLGAPYEARNHYLHLSYYDPVPTEPATNDDLDLQLVWLRHLAEFGFGLTGEQLGQIGSGRQHTVFLPVPDDPGDRVLLWEK